MARVPVSSGKVSKIEAKLTRLCEQKEYYEAHQLYRTIFNRYVAQKKDKEAMHIVEEGIVTLLNAQQFESATDLGLMFINKLKEDKAQITLDLLSTVEKIHHLYGYEEKCRETFMKAAIKWSSLVNEHLPQGHPFLHQLQAKTYWQEQNYPKARRHFLYSGDFEDFGMMLVECATKHGNKGECEFFLAQSVLQLLVLKNVFRARSVYMVYTGRHPYFQEEQPPYRHAPLANYLWFLLLLIETTKDVEVFHCLNDVYSQLLDCDPQYRKYLCQIGQTYFGINPPKSDSQPGNLLEGLFSAFTGSEQGQSTSGGLGEILNSMGSAFGGVGSSSGPMDSSGPVGPPSSSSATQLELD